jgi:methionine-rich copper-binding protein CopC
MSSYRTKHLLLVPARLLSLAVLVLAACSPAASLQPTADSAIMAKETESAAMMAKETESAAMMMQETDTAMMAKETESAAMTMKETDTAMMAKETESAMMSETPDAMSEQGDAMMTIPPQQFAAHFVDSMPMHEEHVASVPEMVLLNFNFTLSDASTITIEKDGKELVSGAGKLGDKKLSMTSALPADAGPGLYVVKYTACWPDNSCHDGQFAFVVDEN